MSVVMTEACSRFNFPVERCPYIAPNNCSNAMSQCIKSLINTEASKPGLALKA